MAEYLAPGVYVEEFDSGLKPMEGVSTSTAGFIGLTERGALKGIPEFVGSFSEFQRKFGGYLPRETYGERRYLPLAVEQFFANGGSRCFVTRILPGMDADTAADRPAKAAFPLEPEPPADTASQEVKTAYEKAKTAYTALVSAGGPAFAATSEGVWGNRVRISFSSDPLTTGVLAVPRTNDGKIGTVDGAKLTVANTRGFAAGGVAAVRIDGAVTYHLIKSVTGAVLEFEAATPVTAGNIVMAELFTPEQRVVVSIRDNVMEEYGKVSFDSASDQFILTCMEKSAVVSVRYLKPAGSLETVYASVSGKIFELAGGRDCKAGDDVSKTVDASTYQGTDGGPGHRSGLCAFRDIPEISIVAAPGVVENAEAQAVVTHCDGMLNRVCILDMPRDLLKVTELQSYRANFDTSFAAIYHPWIQVFDALEKKPAYIPPSGAVAGIYARTDNTRGVHKAPANEVVRGCTGLSTLFGKPEQDMLNPVGINLIRSIQGQGIRVWGARTCSSDPSWKYINVRRLFVFIEETIRRNTGWAVFEPNDQLLWTKVSATITSFLGGLWRDGALAGASEGEAYFVNIGKGSTMTQDDILNGRLICVIGVAPVRPAEFVIFRITQIMESNG